MIDLQTAKSNDIDFLWQMLFFASRSDECEGATPLTIQADSFLSRYVAGWGRPGDQAVIAFWQGKRIGAAWLRRMDDIESNAIDQESSLFPELAIAVAPQHRRKGIGGSLLRQIIAEAEANQVPAITLAVRSTSPAVALYREFGFLETERVINRVGTESIKMIRRLGQAQASNG